MISNNLNIGKSNNSIPTYAIPFPRFGFSMFIDFGTPIQVTVPGNSNIAIIEYNSGAKVFVNQGSSAETLVTLGSAVSSNGRINPSGLWYVKPDDILWFQTFNTSGDVLSVSFYNNNENPQ